MNTQKIEHLRKIIESLEKMPEEKYDRAKNWKYLQFTKNGDYLGFSHFEIDPSGLTGVDVAPLTHLVPMLAKENTIRALEAKIETLSNGCLMEEKKGYVSQQDIEEYVFGQLSDVYNRLSRFYEIAHRIRPRHFWPTFKRVYNESLKKYYYRSELRKTFRSDIPQKHRLMSKEEKAILDSLDDKVTIYRAMSAKEGDLKDYGLSWTLYKDVAALVGKHIFQDIWEHSGFFVEKLEVDKSDLHAFFNSNNMWEVVYVQRKEEIPEQYLEFTLIPLKD